MQAMVRPIDRELLTPVVRRALGCETAEVVEWRRELVGRGYWSKLTRGGIQRLSGSARDGGRTLEWRVILKIIPMTGDDGSSSGRPSWARELDAYASGLLASLPPGLRAPRCFGTTEWPGEAGWIWMEEVVDSYGGRWPRERLGVAARHLGQLEGAYLTGHPLPDYPWLRQPTDREGFLGWWGFDVTVYPTMLRENPFVRRGFVGDQVERTVRVWEEIDGLFEALSRLPRTFAHGDFTRYNLLARDEEGGTAETVAVDWAYCGLDWMGQDVAKLLPWSVIFGEVEPEDIFQLHEMVFDGYLDGLRDVGWRGDARQARLGYVAHSALQGTRPIGLYMLDEGRRAFWEGYIGVSADETLDRWAEEQRALLDLADEARALIPLVRAGGEVASH